MIDIESIRSAVRTNITVTADRAKVFFKTGSGHYAEDDEFIGVTVPNLRKLSKDFSNINLFVLQNLLSSKINEERLLALFILTSQYQKADTLSKEELHQFYLDNLQYVNNWNLVDASAHLILGSHIYDKDRSILLQLAKSNILWERRVAIVSTWCFIKRNDLEWTFKIANLLLDDKQDLIHKAVGWMLREAGKRDKTVLLKFLSQKAPIMPRTMLRYAIEKFPEEQRKTYLSMRKPSTA